MDSFSLISDSAYVAQVRILLSSHFFLPCLLLKIQRIRLYCDYTYATKLLFYLSTGSVYFVHLLCHLFIRSGMEVEFSVSLAF